MAQVKVDRLDDAGLDDVRPGGVEGERARRSPGGRGAAGRAGRARRRGRDRAAARGRRPRDRLRLRRVDAAVRAPVALLQQLAWHVDRDPYVLLLLRGRTREWLVEEVTARQDRADLGRVRGDDADPGRGDPGARGGRAERARAGRRGVAGYDEAVSRLL